MVTMHRGPNWKIAVYAGDHGVPHFHIEGRGFRASVAIATLEIIAGAAPRRERVLALAWALIHQTELKAKWEELNP